MAKSLLSADATIYQCFLGSITVIMNELLESGYLLKTNKGKFLKNKQDLLERWVVAYNEILKPKQLIRRMTFKDAELHKNWADLKLPSDIYWGRTCR